MQTPSADLFTKLPELEQYKLLLQSQLFSVHVINGSGTVIFAAPSVEKIFGYSPKDFIGKDNFLFIHPEERANYQSICGSFHQAGEDATLQYRMQLQNGHWRWMETVFRVAGKDFHSIICETHDITLTKLISDSMQDSLDWLTNVMDAFRDAIFIEENEKVVFVNKAFAQLYGYDSIEEVIGRHVSEFQAPEDSQKMLEYTRTRQVGKYAPQVYQFYGCKKDQSYLLLEASVSTLHLGERKIIITVIHDLSDPALM